jgi:hypothetical protein
MLRWLRTLFTKPDSAAEFRLRQADLIDTWFRTAAAGGKPKWLTWAGYEVMGEPVFRDRWAVVPVQVRFEPVPDGPMEDVPQARDPRPVVAVFAYRGGWTTDGRAVFNLSAEQVVTRLR